MWVWCSVKTSCCIRSGSVAIAESNHEAVEHRQTMVTSERLIIFKSHLNVLLHVVGRDRHAAAVGFQVHQREAIFPLVLLLHLSNEQRGDFHDLQIPRACPGGDRHESPMQPIYVQESDDSCRLYINHVVGAAVSCNAGGIAPDPGPERNPMRICMG